MKYKYVLLSALVSSSMMVTSCAIPYHLSHVDRSRILIDSRYDAHPDAIAAAFIQPYRARVDSVTSPVVGEAATDLLASRPENRLSNLLPDVLMWAAKSFNEKPVFAVYNMGGMRASISKGVVTIGDVLEVAPFENKICFLTLTGDKVLELFADIAGVGGEGVSHGVELTISKQGKLVSALLNGQEIDPKASYRVVTIDYLAQGNDKMDAFKYKTDLNSPQNEYNNVRYVIMDYFRDSAAHGKVVSSEIEGRIKVVE